MMFSIFSMFSMFSQFSPCSPIRHCKIPQFVKPCIILETLIVMNKRRNYFPSGHQWWWQAFVLPRGDFYTLYCVYSFAILLSPIVDMIVQVIDMGGEAISSNEYLGVGKVTEFRSDLRDPVQGHHQYQDLNDYYQRHPHRCDHQIWVEDGSMHPQQRLQLLGGHLRPGNVTI